MSGFANLRSETGCLELVWWNHALIFCTCDVTCSCCMLTSSIDARTTFFIKVKLIIVKYKSLMPPRILCSDFCQTYTLIDWPFPPSLSPGSSRDFRFQQSPLIAFRNFEEESKRQPVWESDKNAPSTANGSRDNLASLYRPPFDLMFNGTFDKV